MTQQQIKSQITKLVAMEKASKKIEALVHRHNQSVSYNYHSTSPDVNRFTYRNKIDKAFRLIKEIDHQHQTLLHSLWDKRIFP